MEEKNLRKKVIKYTVVLALISAVIIGCSAIVVVAVRKAEERSYTAYVDSLVNEYRLRFEERMASAFETLQLMGELMEDGLLSKESIVTDQIQNLSENSSFFKLSYYDIRSEEQLFQLPGSDLEYEFSNRPEEAQEAIRRAWEGETAVSQVYEQDGVQVITYVSCDDRGSGFRKRRGAGPGKDCKDNGPVGWETLYPLLCIGGDEWMESDLYR